MPALLVVVSIRSQNRSEMRVVSPILSQGQEYARIAVATRNNPTTPRENL